MDNHLQRKEEIQSKRFTSIQSSAKDRTDRKLHPKLNPSLSIYDARD